MEGLVWSGAVLTIVVGTVGMAPYRTERKHCLSDRMQGLWPLCAILACFCASGCGSKPPAITDTLLRGAPFSESAINLAIFRKEALLTVRNVQIIAYFDAQEQINLVFRDLATGSLVTR